MTVLVRNELIVTPNVIIMHHPACNYLFEVNNRNTRARCEICLKLTIKTYMTPGSSVSIVNFEQVIVGLPDPVVLHSQRWGHASCHCLNASLRSFCVAKLCIM